MLIFIVGPLIYVSRRLSRLFVLIYADTSCQLFWNIFLIVLGRHPIQNPHYINPEIGKLSKAIVEKIPLVMYIPFPPGEDEKEKASKDGIAKP